MKKYWITVIAALLSVVVLQSCLKKPEVGTATEPQLPATPYRYSDINLPDHLGAMLVGIDDNVATLGRVLFYDPRLSINNTISCGSCHKQSVGFSDARSSSIGFEGKSTPRNTMPIINTAFCSQLFWDSRVTSTDELVLKPVQNHIEMGMESLTMLETKLKNVPYYKDLFQKAFGSTNISSDLIGQALSQFLNSMVSCNSKYDEGVKTEFANFTQQEILGKNIFHSDKAMCGSCHTGHNFSIATQNSMVNPGDSLFIPIDPMPGGNPYQATSNTTNTGLDDVTKDAGQGQGRFRIVPLRNIDLTAPYMHDGRFNTLEEVVDHYNEGIQNHPNLDVKFKKNGQPIKMGLTDQEKQALVAFMKTLTDTKLFSDEKFSDPFVQK